MKKRILPVLLVLALSICLLPTAVYASGAVENRLHDVHQNVYAAENFTSIDTFELNNPLNLDVALDDPCADFAYWHFVDTGKTSEYAEVTFVNKAGEKVTWTILPNKGEGQHYAVITPSGWMLADGVSYAAAAGNFVLSHSGDHEATLGTIKATALVDKFYNEYKSFEDYERDVDKFYERDVDEYYERDVDEYYERSVTEIYDHHAQKTFVPVFTRRVISCCGTLVTRLTYNGTTAKATPVNGGAMKNGHTYVEVNVAEASEEGGVWYTIADSSKNNGKKTPAEYNIPIDYQYNVQIRDGKLTVSFGDDLVFASVGAYVVTNPGKEGKNFPGNAPAHSSGSVTVDLPKGAGSVVYLYTHIEALGWYAGEDEYEFVEWMLKDVDYGEYELVNTEYGEYELVNTELGEYELANTVYGDYELVNTEYGEYELVKEWQEFNRKVAVPYEGGLTLTVNGEEKPLDEEFTLIPGVYEFVLSGNGEFAPVSKTVTVLPGDNETVDFGTIAIQLADDVLDPVKSYSDRAATIHETDRTATVHKADRPTVEHYADAETVKQYKEEWIWDEDIYLGNDYDPFGEYAVII